MNKTILLRIIGFVFLIAAQGVLCCSAGQFDQASNCQPCPTNTYSLGGAVTECSPCSTCATCDSTTGNCLTCSAGYQLDNNVCAQCTEGTYSTGGTDVCHSCDPSCIVCNSANGQCAQCNPGLAPNGMICSACNQGTFSTGSNACQPCDSICATCSVTNGSCLSCQPGYQTQDGSCFACPPNTFSPNGEGQCQSCLTCQSCNSLTGVCTQCLNGFGLNGTVCSACTQSQFTNITTFKCNDCDKSCLTCWEASPQQCTGCREDFDFSNGSCSKCPDGTTSDGSHPCEKCTTPNCIACTNSDVCEACYANYTLILSTHQCGWACSVSGCQLCVINSTCAICSSGYLSDGKGGCIECAMSNCTFCSAPNVCQSCDTPLVPSVDSSLCVSCSLANCKVCSADDYCSECAAGFGPVGGVCFICGVAHCTACNNATMTCTDCENNYVYDSHSSTCEVVCNTPNCLSCSQPNICSACAPNFTLDAASNICFANCGIDECVDCAGSTCNQCLSAFILLGQTCTQLCNIENCLTCQKDAFHLCEVCAQPLSLSIDATACVYCSGKNCLKCNAEGMCSECAGDLQPNYGECVLCQVDNCEGCWSDNKCYDCADGFSLNNNASGIHDQCVACMDPCMRCNSNGTCAYCSTPYTVGLIPQSPYCFLCADPRCSMCSSPSPGQCTYCSSGYSLINGACLSTDCAPGCLLCENSTFCTSCQYIYYYLQNNTCLPCPNLPTCLACSSADPSICLLCPKGYYRNNNTCFVCPDYCQQCQSDTYCYSLYEPDGFIVIPISNTINILAACDPGCKECSASNPELCSFCMTGYYLNQNSYCVPCAISSSCAYCSSSNPSLCLSCFPGYFLNNNSVCVQCASPCTACANATATLCTGCAIGYVLISSNHTCVLPSALTAFGTAATNCANSVLATNSDGSQTLSCNLCLPGFGLTPAGCAPCIQGCQICNQYSLTGCITCSPGFMLTEQNLCVACEPHCLSCSPAGCSQCAESFMLTHKFTCELPCSFPCISCNSTNPAICYDCISGYSLKNSQCVADISCNSDSSCLVCPFGYNLLVENTAVKITQSCVQCNTVSNCARCSMANTSECLSCPPGNYLSNGVCLSCPYGCSECISETMCTKCSYIEGFIPQQSGSLQDNRVNQGWLLNCIACSDNCNTCLGSPSTCTSCDFEYTLVGTVCVSDYNYLISVTLKANLPVFSNNYLAFINSIAVRAGVTAENILVKSITGNPVNIDMIVSSNANSPNGFGDIVNLNSILQVNSTLNNMVILSSSISITCPSPLVQSTSGVSCVSCYDILCDGCSSDNYCSNCAQGYGAIDGVCYLCGVMDCWTCDSKAMICTQCYKNYNYNSASNTCIAVCDIQNCATCSLPNSCSICATNFTLDPSSNACIENCGINYCVDCSDQKCNKCLTNYTMLGSSCVLLCDIEFCQSCQSNAFGLCAQCQPGFNLSVDATICLSCSVPNCSKCGYENECSECLEGLQASGGQCLMCEVDNCLFCSGNNQCEQCFEGYSLNSKAQGTSDQCLVCLNPCESCNSDGSCSYCSEPYTLKQSTQTSGCILCADPNCESCSDANVGSCTVCFSGFSLSQGACTAVTSSCPTGCYSCINSTFCTKCLEYYYYMSSNNTCIQCASVPACLICSGVNPQLCVYCEDGYYLNGNSICSNCPSYCATCQSATWCTELNNPSGYTLLTLSSTVNIPAACDPGCQECSSSNPQFCITCYDGYFMTTNNYCSPCAAASLCASCSQSNSASCLTCFPGYFLNGSQCVQCAFPCTACLNRNAIMCSACVVGYVLNTTSHTCVSASSSTLNAFGTVDENCANSMLTSVNGNYSLTCSLCLSGYALTAEGCAPCIQGCLVCSSTSLSVCQVCGAGYFLNASNICVKDIPNCMGWSSFSGCEQCVSGYFLSSEGTCQLLCVAPCATCDSSNPSTCLTCLSGYSIAGGNCMPDTSCSKDGSCLSCPFGYSLSSNNSNIKINQMCVKCDSKSNCARCNITKTSQCLSCLSGYYLNGNSCQACANNCASCISYNQCTACANGYINLQSGNLLGNSYTSQSNPQLLNCTACTDNCASCYDSPSTCTSCIGGFTLYGTVCLSNFNYQLAVTFNVALTTFSNNYVAFINQIAAAAGVSVKNILVQSIVSGSVTVNMQVSSNAPAGSSAAVAAENQLNNLISQGNSIAGMSVASSSINTNGGSNGDGGSSGSDQKVIILATVIPCAVLLLVMVVVILICVKRGRKEQESSVIVQKEEHETGRNLEMGKQQKMMAENLK